MRTIVLFGVLAACLAGCKGPCQSLADKRCECAGSPTDKTNCQQQNAQAEITYSRTAEQEDQCNQLLSVCDCKYLDTPEGKKNCGLAR